MSPHRQNHQSRRVTADKPHDLRFSNESSNEVEMVDRTEQNAQEKNRRDSVTHEILTIDENEEELRLRLSVREYAKTQCEKCNAFIKTINGGTSTLKKHLIDIHGLIELTVSASSSRTNIEDDRSFGDLQRSDIQKFLAEAIPGMI